MKEKKAHEELLKGAERMAKDKQRHSLETMAKYNTSKSRERHQSEHNRILKEGIHRKAHTRREESVKEAAHEMLRTQKEEITGKKKRYFHHKKSARRKNGSHCRSVHRTHQRKVCYSRPEARRSPTRDRHGRVGAKRMCLPCNRWPAFASWQKLKHFSVCPCSVSTVVALQ